MSPLPPEPEPPTRAPQAHVLGFAVDALPRALAFERAALLMDSPRPAHVVTGNALMALESAGNPALADACAHADLVLPDSSGLVWAARRLHQPRLERLPGVDLAFELCRRAARKGAGVYLLGGSAGTADRAAAALRAAIPDLRICGVRDGFFRSADEPAVIEGIRDSGARLVLVATGMPRQEIWIHRNKARLPAGAYIGVGGSFDVWAGTVRRAPGWMQDTGIEWLFRLFQEPWRFRRMAGLPRFAWRVLRASTFRK